MAERAINQKKAQFLSNIAPVSATLDEIVRDKLECGKFPLTKTGWVKVVAMLVCLAALALFLAQTWDVCLDKPDWYDILFPVCVGLNFVVELLLYMIFSCGATVKYPGKWVKADIILNFIFSLIGIIGSVVTIATTVKCTENVSFHKIPGPLGVAGGGLSVVGCAAIFLMYRYVEDEEDSQPPRLSRPIPTVPSIRHQPAPERSQHNSSIFDISLDPNYNVGSVVTFTELPSYDSEYRVVTNMITNKRNFKVDRIDKIANPYLIKAYELKREQKRLQHADAFVEERLLFHGTKRANVDAICKMNFDWRRCKAHEYGKGVSFSPNSTYSSNYSDPGLDNKVMLVAKVLVANSCIGNKFMELPPDGYDTSQKGEDGVVIVKYEDSEFYPAYKISYHVLDENFGKGNRYKSRGRRII
uniref:Poly [ADP-ribose] polymerase n=1 Tax=Tenebrio molitor TaxID=7067 RepID=A0A8J6L6B3_TENMO|nr:hypothetical protein GEV33_014911 [Tenebrio molitor]